MITNILLPTLLATLTTVLGMAQPISWRPVYELFEERTEFRVGALEVRLVQLKEWNWELRLSLNGRRIHKVDGLTSPGAAHFGLFLLLGTSNPELIVHADTGGSSPYAVCWIYTTEPTPQLLYSSERYWPQHTPCGDLEVADLDGDGVYEIRHVVASFRGYEGGCNACSCSPCPEAIFRYDPAKKKYRPANWEFPMNLKARIEEHLRYLKGIDRTADVTGQYYAGGWLNVAFEYLYAGEDQDALQFLKGKLGAEGAEEERRAIVKNIGKERFYREIEKARRDAARRK